METALHFLGPALLDYTANGRVDARIGNRDPRWRRTASIRRATAATAGGGSRAATTTTGARSATPSGGELASDERYATAAARLERQDELDELIGAWSGSAPRKRPRRCCSRAAFRRAPSNEPGPVR
jgi:crotonobetainyl-CoA:carnitine CoA-transferase CaiB-like acyl-CoA transferase